MKEEPEEAEASLEAGRVEMNLPADGLEDYTMFENSTEYYFT